MYIKPNKITKKQLYYFDDIFSTMKKYVCILLIVYFLNHLKQLTHETTVQDNTARIFGQSSY